MHTLFITCKAKYFFINLLAICLGPHPFIKIRELAVF